MPRLFSPIAPTPSVTIPGNRVLPNWLRLTEADYETALKKTLGKGSLESYSRTTRKMVVPKKQKYDNNFVATVHAAYAKHYPLTLSPDMIWLLIVQGFATHVRENAETLRDQFVAHEGKLLLQVERPEFLRGFDGNDWEGVIAELSSKIREHVGHQTHDTLIPTFSTTGIVEKAAFEVALLDSMQQYFDYDVLTLCGIPSFILEGSPDDWQSLRDHAANLAQYDLDWWTPHLLKVLDEFVSASAGQPTPTFWQDFYCDTSCRRFTGKFSGLPCGHTHISGHIVNLFPYRVYKTPMPGSYKEAIRKGDPSRSEVRKNDYLGLPTEHSSPEGGREFNPHQGFQNMDIPSGLSLAPFTWTMPLTNTVYPMEFVAGFVGMTQDARTRALRPEIGWAIRSKET